MADPPPDHERRWRARLDRTPVIAILRGLPEARLLPSIAALVQGGIGLLEIALAGPEDTRLITLAAQAFPEVLIGAGTVVNAALAEQAVRAGATFLLTPHVAEDAIAAGRQWQVPVIAGAYTATEMQRALALGSAAVKLFPASLGGPDYLRALRAPYPQLPVVAVGGVGPSNMHDYLRAGAIGVGLGSELTRLEGEISDHDALRARAQACTAAFTTPDQGGPAPQTR